MAQSFRIILSSALVLLHACTAAFFFFVFGFFWWLNNYIEVNLPCFHKEKEYKNKGVNMTFIYKIYYSYIHSRLRTKGLQKHPEKNKQSSAGLKQVYAWGSS